MIRANCRARFTAADFDFIVRTLARSQTDQVSLVDLLSDIETRDSILDHPCLVDAILNHCGHLRISSQFYFYVLARHVLQQGGIGDRKLCDYVASLLGIIRFSSAEFFIPQSRDNGAACAAVRILSSMSRLGGRTINLFPHTPSLAAANWMTFSKD